MNRRVQVLMVVGLFAAAGCGVDGPDATGGQALPPAEAIDVEVASGGEAQDDAAPADETVDETAETDHDETAEMDHDEMDHDEMADEAMHDETECDHESGDAHDEAAHAEDGECTFEAHDEMADEAHDEMADDEAHDEMADDEAHDEMADDEAHEETAADDGTGAVEGLLVHVEMFDFGYRMDTTEIPMGEPVTFRFINTGAIEHEAMFGSEHEQEEFKTLGDHGDHGDEGHHGEISAITLAAGETGDITVTFDSSGEVWIGCHLPGHWDAGMATTFQVG